MTRDIIPIRSVVRPDFDFIKQDIFRGESGGDYDALWNYQNRPGGDFENIKITDMTVDEALHFASPQGQGYGYYVKNEVNKIKPGEGVYASPMGAYQVVGNTLKMAKKGLGLSGDEKMTPALQDLIGKYIYDVQGTDAWAGYRGPRHGPKPKGYEGAYMMEPDPQKSEKTQSGIMGLIQAGGRAVKKGLQDPDLMNRLALGFNTMRLDPDPNIAAAIRESMSDRREMAASAGSKNATVAHLRKIGATDPYALELADAVETGGITAKAALTAYYQTKMSGQNTQRSDVYKVPQGTVTVSSKKNGETEYRLNGRLITDPSEIENIMSQANLFEVSQAGDIQEAKTQAGEDVKTNISLRERKNNLITVLSEAQTVVNNIMSNPAMLADGLGAFNGNKAETLLTAQGKTMRGYHRMLQGILFKSAFEALKGGGQITENETRQAKDAAARMTLLLSPEDYMKAVQEFLTATRAGIGKIQARMDGEDLTIPEPIDFGSQSGTSAPVTADQAPTPVL